MKHKDIIYGQMEITEPVILELIQGRALQRLKGVDQAGYYEPYFPNTRFSRLSHSIGVYLLLYRYGASLEEQIAGLIHDVSHTAFSHCIDYAVAEGSETTQSHQDDVFEEFVKKSEIPEILSKYNINIDYILADKNFPLKEKELPWLCADRIDYSLRTAVIFKATTKKTVNYILDNLTIYKKNWIFKNFTSAEIYTRLFYKIDKKYFSGFSSGLMFRTVGDYLKYALEKKYITKTDFFSTDNEVLQKINLNLKKDKHLDLLWQRMNNKIKAVNNPKNYDAKVFCKSRIVDPLFFDKGKIRSYSEVKTSWKKVLETESGPKEYFIKFLPV